MLLYDHNRTEEIVERLREGEAVAWAVTIITSVALFAATGMLVAAVIQSRDAVLMGGCVGTIVGFGIGRYSMILFSAMIEWMCQMLIAQGEVLETAKRNRKAQS